MPVGVFGKYPQKRDFISLGIPRSILEPFEAWLQSAVAASRNQLGRKWQELYLVAPLWRFWIGPETFGMTCSGVTMPSVDGIGRFFPLTLIAHGDDELGVLPPTVRSNDGWYRALEDRLLLTLGEEPIGDPASLIQSLSMPATSDEPPRVQGARLMRGRIWTAPEQGADALLASMREEDYVLAAAGRSYWWTDGGNASGAAVYSCAGLPDPYFYIRMIGGLV